MRNDNITADYINRISDPYIKQIFIERVFGRKSWLAVAVAVGVKGTADSVRQQYNRYLKAHPLPTE
jgi:hypothetical protein